MNAPLAQQAVMREQPNAELLDPEEPPFAWVGELLAFLRRQRSVIIRCVFATLALAVIYLLTAAPTFTADATLLVDIRPSQLFNQAASVSDAQIENALIESEVEVLRSAGLARRVVSDLKLGQDKVFVGHPSFLGRLTGSLHALWSSGNGPGSATADQDRLVQRFMQSVTARRVGLTYVIEIDATARDPELAARLANGLIGAYLAERLAINENALRQAGGWVEERLTELQAKALKADQDVQAFKSQSGIVDTGRGFLNEQQLSELNSQLVAARAKTADAQAHLDRIAQVSGGSDAIATADQLKSPVINELREHYLADADRVAEWSARYGPQHAAVITLRKEMAALQASIGSEERRIQQAAVSDLRVARAGQAELQAQVEALSGQSAATDTSRATLRSLQSKADTYRSLYVSFLQRAMQTAQDESAPVADAHVVTSARPPLTKSAPKTKLVLAGAIVLGVGAAFAIGLLREALDRRLRTSADLRTVGFSFLASLPLVRGMPALERFAADHPDSAFGLGLRQLQRRIVQQCDSGRFKVLGILAPIGAAGSTTVATNLVRSMVRSGHDAVTLDLSGADEPRATSRGRLDSLRRDHEIVVVDMPPLSRPSEAHAMLGDIDGLALVVESGTIDAAHLLGILRDAGIDRGNVLGVVINKADRQA
jgi:succinoglycan biosynthesis transport protein ExoP